MPNEPLTDDQITDLVCSHQQARDVYLAGYARGHVEGQKHAQLSQEEQAQLAARLFAAAQENEEEISRQIQHDVQWFDVERARQEHTTKYESGAAA